MNQRAREAIKNTLVGMQNDLRFIRNELNQVPNDDPLVQYYRSMQASVLQARSSIEHTIELANELEVRASE